MWQTAPRWTQRLSSVKWGIAGSKLNLSLREVDQETGEDSHQQKDSGCTDECQPKS